MQYLWQHVALLCSKLVFDSRISHAFIYIFPHCLYIFCRWVSTVIKIWIHQIPLVKSWHLQLGEEEKWRTAWRDPTLSVLPLSLWLSLAVLLCLLNVAGLYDSHKNNVNLAGTGHGEARERLYSPSFISHP